MNEFHKQAALFALKEMFETSKHFSICDLKHILTITGQSLNRKDEAALSALHCHGWADMPPELRQMVFDKIKEVLQSEPSFNLDSISTALDVRFPRLHGSQAH